MRKLFEIPIYAISSKELERRVEHHVLDLKKGNFNSDGNMLKYVIEKDTFPMRIMDYNHIVGFICVCVTKQDILFRIYLPVPYPGRYFWNSTRKKYVRNVHANGTHIYLGALKTNKDIRSAVSGMLDQVTKEQVPSRCFVDRDAFDTINPHLDYLSLIACNLCSDS